MVVFFFFFVCLLLLYHAFKNQTDLGAGLQAFYVVFKLEICFVNRLFYM